VVIERIQGRVRAVMTHCGVDGTVYNEDVIDAN